MIAAFIPFTMVMVLLSPPCLKTGTYTERCPSMRTMLYCNAPESIGFADVSDQDGRVANRFERHLVHRLASGNWLLA